MEQKTYTEHHLILRPMTGLSANASAIATVRNNISTQTTRHLTNYFNPTSRLGLTVEQNNWITQLSMKLRV